jgi:hypothetical protein
MVFKIVVHYVLLAVTYHVFQNPAKDWYAASLLQRLLRTFFFAAKIDREVYACD